MLLAECTEKQQMEELRDELVSRNKQLEMRLKDVGRQLEDDEIKIEKLINMQKIMEVC